MGPGETICYPQEVTLSTEPNLVGARNVLYIQYKWRRCCLRVSEIPMYKYPCLLMLSTKVHFSMYICVHVCADPTFILVCRSVAEAFSLSCFPPKESVQVRPSLVLATLKE